MSAEVKTDPVSAALESGSYEDFSRRLAASACSRCALSQNRTNIVIDRGNPKAKIMVIGEAPGQQEDLQGRAFVGRAGRSFDETMAAVDLDTNKDMFIANVVKCRPPGNRRPQSDEAESCLPLLKKQIELIRPKIVVLLGATALRYIGIEKKAAGMKDSVGKFFDAAEYPGIKFVVFYHPAAVFYNRKLQPEVQRHANLLRAHLDSLR